jgi:hypothetical protein
VSIKNITLSVCSFVIVGFILSGCTASQSPSQIPTAKNNTVCQPREITLEGYGDKGHQLANCFVEYPGEPSRPDKSYYIVEDICGQFTKEFIQHVLGKPIIRSEPPKISSLSNCSYYLDDQNYVMLVLDYLSIDNQKKGQEALGRTTASIPSIPMRNLVAYQEDNNINTIYLILSDNKFISLQRSSNINLTKDELISFAANLAENIKNYK